MIGCVLGISNVINGTAIKNNAVTFLLVIHKPADVVVHLNPVMQSRAFLAKANVIALLVQRSKRLFFANVMMMPLNPIVHESAFSL
jgi:hypothetical protein